jgi:cholesterol transport system auxiliary component
MSVTDPKMSRACPTDLGPDLGPTPGPTPDRAAPAGSCAAASANAQNAAAANAQSAPAAPPRGAHVARRAVLLGGAAGLAAACSPLQSLTTAVQAPDLYTLSPKGTFDDDLPQLDVQIVVDEPTANAAVNTDRIAVRPHPLKVEYFPRVRWVDRAPLMVQTLLIESFDNTGDRIAVGRRASGLAADYTLLTDLREFQAETSQVAGGPGAAADAVAGGTVAATAAAGADVGGLSALVRLTTKVVREPEGLIIATSTFSQRIPAASGEMLDIAAAFDEALGQCIRDAVSWTLREIAVAEALRRRRR